MRGQLHNIAPKPVQGDSLWAKVVLGSQMNDLLNDLRCSAKSGVYRTWLLVDKYFLPQFLVSLFPAVKRLTSNSKVPSSLGHVACLLYIIEDLQLSFDVSLGRCHLGNLLSAPNLSQICHPKS